MPDQRPHGVICYWRYRMPARLVRRFKVGAWCLAEAYPVDADGHPQVATSTEHAGRHESLAWMFRTNRADDDPRPRLGRAVTIWDMESGVRLLAFHPPAWVPWLAVGFYEQLCKLTDWWTWLEGGHDLYLGTARAAEKFVFVTSS